jgi:hypothetical protein
MTMKGRTDHFRRTMPISISILKRILSRGTIRDPSAIVARAMSRSQNSP